MGFHITLTKTSRAAAQLVSRCPPRRSRQNMYAAEELACATFLEKAGYTEEDEIPEDETADFRVAFLDKMVERVDQAVECLICDSCTTERGGNNFWFVAAEYNRSGDFFRCPRCHAFITGHANDEEESAEPSQLVPPTESVHTPPKFVAWFEHAVNVMMATYTRLYYAHHDLRDDTVISSCYAWAIDESVASGCEDLTDDDGEDNSAVPAEIGVAIYILHRHRGEGAGHEGDDTTETNQAAARVQNQWTSSHVASIRPSLDGSAFAFQSSVMLDIVQAQHDDDDRSSGLQKQRVHGLVATDTTKFHGRSVAVKVSSRISPMEQLGTAAVVELCEHLQRVENALRDTLESLYIGKVGSMMAQSLRVDPQQLKSSTHQKAAPSAASKALHQDPVIAQEEMSLPADSTEKKKKKSKSSTSESGASKRSAWEAALDEDGNTYYYHTETGETSWDPPAEEQEGQQLSLNAAETAPEEEQGVAPSAAPDATAEEESGAVDPLSILESLGLTQPAEGYYKELKRYLRRFYGIKVFTEESLLQMDDPEYTLGEGENGDEGELRQVLDVLIPVYGDRRKVLKWIARRRTEMEQ